MAAANDVDLGDGGVLAVPYLFQDSLQRQFKGERIARFLAKGTEAAAVHTNVGVIDMLVHDIVSGIAVKPGPDFMGQGPDGNDVPAGEEP